MTSGVRTRLLILSDTHSATPHSSASTNHPFREPLPEADVAIHTGDLTNVGTYDEHLAAIRLLKSLRAPVKIVIPGNHDLTLDTAYCRRHNKPQGFRPTAYAEGELQNIRDLYTGVDAVASGIYYIEEGTRTIRLPNGARLTFYASAYTPEFCNWAFAYPRKQDRFNAPSAENPVPPYVPESSETVDILITHGPPHSILDKVVGDGRHVGCSHLLDAVRRSRPLVHCFGHIHEGWGALRVEWAVPDLRSAAYLDVDETSMLTRRAAYADITTLISGEETLFVNSSIMSVNYKPVQSPWLVDVMLSEANIKDE